MSVAFETLSANSLASAASGASAQKLGLNTTRTVLSVWTDPAGTTPVYILLGTGTASATNWHIALKAGDHWDGSTPRGGIWRGAIQVFGTGTLFSVLED